MNRVCQVWINIVFVSKAYRKNDRMMNNGSASAYEEWYASSRHDGTTSKPEGRAFRMAYLNGKMKMICRRVANG